MNASDKLDWFALERLYYEGCRLFMRGDYDQAVEQFKRIYEETTDLWDVADLVEGYYALPREQWVIRSRPRIETKTIAEQASGANGGGRILSAISDALGRRHRSLLPFGNAQVRMTP